MTSPIPGNDEIITRYLYAMRTRWRQKTREVRIYQLRAIADALPAPLVLATEEHLVAWHDGLRGAPETIAAYTSAAHGIFRWMNVLARPRLRLDDPSLILDRPRIPEATPRPMLDRHYDLALACAVSNPEMYLWLGLMGCCGLRCCEIAWLMVGDVEQLEAGGGLLHVTGKGGKRRIVPAGEMLMLTMRPFLSGRGPVFTRPSDGGPHTPSAISQRVNKHLHDLGISSSAHSLRHRFATDYHALDVDLYRQAKVMGHASVDTTQRYTEVSPVEAAAYIEQLTFWRLHPGERGPKARRRAG